MAGDNIEKLERLSKMLDEGRITEEEFDTLKAELIAGEPPDIPAVTAAPLPASGGGGSSGTIVKIAIGVAVGIVIVIVLIGLVFNQVAQNDLARTFDEISSGLG